MNAPTPEQKTQRVRPWRCTRCGDRFTHEQINNPHDTVYEPRWWEEER